MISWILRLASRSAVFGKTGVRFVRGVPSTTLDGGLHAALFSPEPAGNTFDHFLVQVEQVWRGNREGGFFLMIGRVDRDGGRLVELPSGPGGARIGRGL